MVSLPGSMSTHVMFAASKRQLWPLSVRPFLFGAWWSNTLKPTGWFHPQTHTGCEAKGPATTHELDIGPRIL